MDKRKQRVHAKRTDIDTIVSLDDLLLYQIFYLRPTRGCENLVQVNFSAVPERALAFPLPNEVDK